jgi:hypothetical protein
MAWNSAELPVITGRYEEFWSTADAAFLLDLSPRAVRDAIARAGLQPAGKRFEKGRGTRHARVYPVTELLRVTERFDRVTTV